MAKFRVTGGEDGTLGIDVGNRRYEAGDLVEMTSDKAQWLIDCGALVKDSDWSPVKATVEPEPEPEPEPENNEDDVVDEDDEDDEEVGL